VTRWAILTGEYPPQPGGVSDYTRLVADSLVAAGDEVRVFAPPVSRTYPAEVTQLPDHFGPRGLWTLDRELTTLRPDCILIQYVPHAFGWKAMNLPFAAWVAVRAARIAPVWVMFHEVWFPFRWRPASHAALWAATRVMARLLAGAASRVFVSIPAWGGLVRRACPRARRAEWLPVPCSVGTTAAADQVVAVRRGFPPDAEVVGHFGTFGGLIADVLEPAARELLARRPRVHLLLIGRNSDAFRDRLGCPRVTATGELPPDHLPASLRACDTLLQPYSDGISSRRTSVMAGLANGVPVVSNLGFLSEPLWASTDGVRVASGPDPAELAAAVGELLDLPPAARAAIGERGAHLYQTTFDVSHTVARLRAVEFRP
jgi:glycosyltransferase involved in cell wall biosynthesis